MRFSAQQLSFVVAALLASSRVHAQGAAAEALFNSGREAMAAGDFARACDQLRESGRLDPAVGTDLNLADCEEKRGRLATAWELFRAVEQKLPPNDDRLAIARARGRALDGRVPRLTLRLDASAPRDTTAKDGKVELGPASFGVALPMDPGPHDLVVSAPRHAPRSFRVELAEGESRLLDVMPGDSATPAASLSDRSMPGSAAHRDAPSGPSGSRTLGFVLGGVGVAGLGVGAAAGLMVLGKKNAVDEGCDARKLCTQAGVDAAGSGRTLELVSNVGWIVGVVGLGAGAYFLLARSSDESHTTASVAPMPAGARLSLERTW